jgi:nuclease S1
VSQPRARSDDVRVGNACKLEARRLFDDRRLRGEGRTQALKFLAHFVGDIHQPLHVGHKKDKGGNGIEVQLYSRKTNLHAVWDDGLIKRRGMDYGPYAKKLEGALTPEVQKADLAVMDPVSWATESHRLAEHRAYRDAKGNPIKSGDTLGDEYANANSPVIDEQLTKAGLRLAKMLNGIYDSGATTPN